MAISSLSMPLFSASTASLYEAYWSSILVLLITSSREAMHSTCSELDAVISFVRLVIFSIDSVMIFKASAVDSTCLTPEFIDVSDSWMSFFISSELSAARTASCLTSPATTANPLPCSPALAASTFALSASN